MPIKSHDGEVPWKKTMTEKVISSLIYQPITQPAFVSVQVIGVAQIINKKSGQHQFTEKDEEVSTLAQRLVRYQPAGFQNGGEIVENPLRRFCFSSSYRGGFHHGKSLLRLLDSFRRSFSWRAECGPFKVTDRKCWGSALSSVAAGLTPVLKRNSWELRCEASCKFSLPSLRANRRLGYRKRY